MGYPGVCLFIWSFVSPTLLIIFPSGNSDLEEPIAIRPTSETAMYPCGLRIYHAGSNILRTYGRLREVDSELSGSSPKTQPVEQCCTMGIQESP